MGASSVYITMITSRHRAGRWQPTSSQTSGVKSGSGLRSVCEVRHRCNCCCLRDAHASERQGCRATEREAEDRYGPPALSCRLHLCPAKA